MRKILFFIFCLLFVQRVDAQESVYRRLDSSLRIMSYNVRNAKGMDLKTDYARVAAVMNGLTPDVIAVQELDNGTRRSGGKDVLAELASLAAMYATYGAAIEYDGGKYGVGILSREEPLSHYNVPLPGREEERTILVAEFNEYIFASTHWSLTKEDRVASVDIVCEIAEQYDKPVFMAGDFNMTPESEELQLLTKNWIVLNNLKLNTFPSDSPDRCIDYVFIYSNPDVEAKLLQNNVLNEPIASDHRPVFVDVKL